MKILYIGNSDYVAAGILQRLKKEGDSLYLLTDSNVNKQDKIKKCKYYSYRGEMDLSEIFYSIMPEVVVFAGEGYSDPVWGQKHKENMSLLMNCLDECVDKDIRQFVYLSSIDVYGELRGCVTEDTPVHPHTIKANILAQNEYMVLSYQKQYHMDVTILRAGQLFGRMLQASYGKWFGLEEDSRIYPIYINDFAEAVKRAIENIRPGIYNVVGSRSYSVREFEAIICGRQLSQDETQKEKQNIDTSNTVVSNEKIKAAFEWIDFWNVDTLFEEGKLEVCEDTKQNEKKKREHKLQGTFTRILENLVLAFIFGLLSYVCNEHSLFSQIDWLLIYVVLISLFWGVKQGAIAVVVSCAAFLFIKRGTIFEMTNFYLYVENLIHIVQYMFFGIIVGYTSDTLRNENMELRGQNESLQNRFDKLKEINKQTVQVKNEYEKRLLDSKESLPNIYSIIKRINVLDSERIFQEVLNVIRELVNTDTVAVYKYQEQKKYMRLLTALNEESMMEGRSWNISNYPRVKYAIDHLEQYEGDVWNNEPAMILPFSTSGDSKIVIVIKNMPIEQLSLYTINMLRTVMLLIEGSIERAMQYDQATREARYVSGTDILIAEEFQKIIELEEEKKNNNDVLSYSLLELEVKEDIISTYNQVGVLFRDVDVFGTDGNGRLFVLLTNAYEDESKLVLNRMREKNVNAKLVEKENIYG